MRAQVQGYPPYKKNDLVKVISGKDKGKTGKVLRMLKDQGLIVVEKINLVKRHTKPSQQDPQGGIIEKESPIHVCKVLPIDAKTGKALRINKWIKNSVKPASTTKKQARVKAK